MKISKFILNSAIAVFLSGGIIFSANADCPTINEVISAFAKNGLAPSGWQLNAYAGKKIDKNFIFNKASWYFSGSKIADSGGGNVVCEYGNKNKDNPGYIVVQTVNFVSAPTASGWREVSDNPKTLVCKSLGDIKDCPF